MEFYVVDPKGNDFEIWVQEIRDFLSNESLKHSEASGELYYLGDDIAAPWDENSILFTVASEEADGLPSKLCDDP